MELAEAVFFSEVGVPKPYDLVDVELAGKVARDPPVGEVHEHQIERLEVLQSCIVALLDDCLHLVEHFVHTWLHFCVVILNVTDKLGQAPENVDLHLHKLLLSDFFYDLILCEFWTFDRTLEEDHQNRRRQVINTLNVGTGRITHGPHEEDSNQHRLHELSSE